jgi:tetratricopeptide (TPR) repeat protein
MEKELQISSATPDGELQVFGFRSGLAGARGQIGKSREFARQGAEALDRMHLEGAADFKAQIASSEALVGNRAQAIKDANEALQTSHTVSVMGNAALALALAGEDQKAFALADEIQRTHPNDTLGINVTVPSVRAIAALLPANPAKADPAKAIDLLNTAALYARSNAGVFYGRGVAYEHSGRYAEAEQDFQKLMGIRSHSGPDILFVAGELEMGRLYHKQGDIPKARISYQNVLAAWKNADPDLPLLHDAKAEYAKLQ